jgi:hypothetical protein
MACHTKPKAYIYSVKAHDGVCGARLSLVSELSHANGSDLSCVPVDIRHLPIQSQE